MSCNQIKSRIAAGYFFAIFLPLNNPHSIMTTITIHENQSITVAGYPIVFTALMIKCIESDG